MGEIIYLEIKDTPEQRENLWQQLEAAERRVEHLKRCLGMIGVELGLDDEPA